MRRAVIQSCPKGYQNEETKICEPCSDAQRCKVCITDRAICSSCNWGFFYFEHGCLEVCPKKTYPKNYVECVACDPSCSACNSDGCLTCESNYPYKLFSQPIICLSKCTGLYYLNSRSMECTKDCYAGSYRYTSVTEGNQCKACEDVCANCENQITCSSCSSNYYLQGTTCSATCSGAYYPDSSYRTCMPCMPGCAVCSNNSTCNYCSQPYYLGLDAVCYSPVTLSRVSSESRKKYPQPPICKIKKN